MNDNICAVVRRLESEYTNGTSTKISEHVEFDMYDTINTIEAYLNSKHISGNTDSLGREKPFFNIVTAAVNIWYRATDIDRKNIRILPDKASDTVVAFIATQLLQNWMREENFGIFLNQWGRSLARYGSSIVKFVRKNGNLNASVVPWARLIVDPIDYTSQPIVEKLYKTPAQLRANKAYDQEVVERLIEARSTRKTLHGDQRDNRTEFIEVYEVHGELEESLLTENEKDTEFVQQMHVVSFVSSGGEYEDYTLYKGREAKSPYMLTHLIEEDGRTLSIGAVEYLFDAQWMKNHTVKNMKDTLDLASKLIFQTSDGAYVGRNVLSAIETGDILIHQVNQPLTQINNSKADIVAFQNFGMEWERLSQTITSTPESMRGDTLPSGTPYSLGAYLGAQANSLFELMTESKGLYIEEMMREFIIPHIKTKMDTKDEIVAILDNADVDKIDDIYIKKFARKHTNEKLKQMVLNGEFPSGKDEAEIEAQLQSDVRDQLKNSLGTQRFFKPSELPEKTWKELMKNLEMRVAVEVTNENTDKGAVMQTLTALLQTIATNPMILQDPNAKMIFGQILTETGKISPLSLSTPNVSPPTGGDVSALQTITA